MWASWTLTRSLAEDVDDGLAEREEINDGFELGDLAELPESLDAVKDEVTDEKCLVGEMSEDVKAGKAHDLPPFFLGLTSFQ